MINITTKSIYALSAIRELAKIKDNKLLKIKEIADRSGAPHGFLEQILLELKKNGILESIKGAKGGYRLAKPIREIRLIDVVDSLETKNQLSKRKENHEVLCCFWDEVEKRLEYVLHTDLSLLKECEEKTTNVLNFCI